MIYDSRVFFPHIEKVFNAKIFLVLFCPFYVFARSYFEFTRNENNGGFF